MRTSNYYMSDSPDSTASFLRMKQLKYREDKQIVRGCTIDPITKQDSEHEHAHQLHQAAGAAQAYYSQEDSDSHCLYWRISHHL
ncbi:hypothetical protein R6Z07F_000540 [Ovis aries]